MNIVLPKNRMARCIRRETISETPEHLKQIIEEMK
jgi:hypothetical protein